MLKTPRLRCRRGHRGVALATAAALALVGLLAGVAPSASADVVGDRVTGWGSNVFQQSSTPGSLAGKTVSAIAAGGLHNLALTSDGHVTAWGYAGHGEISVPPSLADKTVTAIAAGTYHNLALTSDGHVTVWGDDHFGQPDVPASLAGKTVTAIAAGGYHSLVLTSDGHVTGWGYNIYGQTNAPASLDGRTITAIAGGTFHSLALTSDGQITAWGDNSYGQTAVPASLDGETVTAIAAGHAHSLALTAEGHVVSWGLNTSNQSDVPASLADKTVTAIGAGDANSLVATSDGQVTGWGDNGFGQTAVPASLSDQTVTAVDAGYWHSLALSTTKKPNAAPTAIDLIIAAGYQSATPVTLSGSDPDDDDLTFTVASPPAHGVLSGTGTQLTYTPANGYIGTDSFTYTANDGTADSTPATVAITVSAEPNQAPTATDLTVAAGYQSATPVTLSGNDPDDDDLTFTVASPPTHGVLSGTGTQLTYTPANGYTGTDSFTYTANDGTADSTPATVSLTVAAPSCLVASTPDKEFSVDADQSKSAGSIRSGKIRVKKAGELLVAFIAVNGPTTAAQSVAKVSGGGLTWKLAQRENTTAGSSEVWQAYAPGKLSSFRVTATFARTGSSASITVAGFTHAKTATGASAHANGSGSAPRVTLTPQSSRSVVWGVGRVIGSRYDPQPVPGQTESHDHTNKSPKTGYWVQRTKKSTNAGTNVTLTETAATVKPWGYAAVEIRGRCG